MRTGIITRRLLTAIVAVVLLVYFMDKTTSPKIIFIPFLFCGIASVGKNLGLLFHRKKMAFFFDKLFEVCFFIFWFGFLAAACYIMIRDENTRMLPLTVPFWLGGIYFAKRKLEEKRGK